LTSIAAIRLSAHGKASDCTFICSPVSLPNASAPIWNLSLSTSSPLKGPTRFAAGSAVI